MSKVTIKSPWPILTLPGKNELSNQAEWHLPKNEAESWRQHSLQINLRLMRGMSVFHIHLHYYSFFFFYQNALVKPTFV